MDSTIHAFLLSHKGFEFGAVTPKQDHLSINIAGRNVSSKVMLEFLRSGPVQRFLPPHKRKEKPLNYFKEKFPISPARNLFGDRYVTIGDAAGLIRQAIHRLLLSSPAGLEPDPENSGAFRVR
ncbi:MAG: hypothetical protein QF687_04020 [Nitrospinaceae bacterium]|nr:hypothetical protein [Nitrospinaceae bacterium]